MKRRDLVKGILSSLLVTGAAFAVYNDDLGSKVAPDAAPDDMTAEIEEDIRIAAEDSKTIPSLEDFRDVSLEARDARAAAKAAERAAKEIATAPADPVDETQALPETVPLPSARPVPKVDPVQTAEPELTAIPRPRPRPDYTPPEKTVEKPAEKPRAVAKEPEATPRKKEDSALSAPPLLRSASGRVMLYNTHTAEKFNLDFRDVDKRGYNRFMRDHRRNEIIDIDNRLIAQFGKVVQRLRSGGADVDVVELISGYRAPATNSMLQKTRGGQATNSLHTIGLAKDIRVQGVRLTTLHQAASGVAKAGGRGGVGYYPQSNFVHIDVGRLRFW